jgi:3-deoxy-D-manno-octulosonic-acid transferase
MYCWLQKKQMHLLLYKIFIGLYGLGARCLAPWNAKAALWVKGRKNLLQHIGNTWSHTKKDFTIWMHSASLGEFEQGRPVLEALKKQHPQCRIVLTFFSPSGYEIRKHYKGADAVYYLPADSIKNATAFLDIIQPNLVLWVKYEYWYHYLNTLKKRNIPTLLISGLFRSSQPFFKWYGRLHRHMLTCFEQLFVQTAVSKELLHSIGFTSNVQLNGDTRFDRVTTIAASFEALPIIEQFIANAPVIVAGSTWLEDEEELDHFANTNPAIKFIIAPHEIGEERMQEVMPLFKNSIRLSAYNGGPTTANTLIIDNIGMLSRLYHYATIAYVGGGFGDDGLHNILEAATYEKPVLFGPNYEKHYEAVEMVEAGGAFTIENALEAEKVLQELLTNQEVYQTAAQAAGNYVTQNRGATEAILNYIQEKRLLTN